MPDPQVLYIVTAVVVLGLIAWVAMVLLKAPKREESLQRAAAGGGAVPSSVPPPAQKKSAAASTASEPKDSKEKATAEGTSVPDAPIVGSVSGPTISAHVELHDMPTGDLRVDVEEEEEPTGPNALILVTAVGRTDPGLKRKHNEDAYAILEDHHLFVIADGMGRHAAGEVASQLCVDAIRDVFKEQSFDKVPPEPTIPRRGNRIRAAILQANERILQKSRENESYAGMGTTVVAAYFSPSHQRVYIAHVGDSRCYRLRSGKFSQLTMDHTLAAVGIQGKSANVLSRAVGVEDEVEVDVAMESPLHDDFYLLCSDGLSRMVSDGEIQTAMTTTTDLEGATKKLIDTANERGGRDNITCILVRVDKANIAAA